MATSNCIQDEIAHNHYSLKGKIQHSITLNGKEGLRVGFKELARNGCYVAATYYYRDQLPEGIFKIDPTPIYAMTNVYTD